MSVVSQQLLAAYLDHGEIPVHIPDIGIEGARGILLIAEVLHERGEPIDHLRHHIVRAVPRWVDVISPILVSCDRPDGHCALWIPPAGEPWSWYRALHNLQLTARLYPSLVKPQIHSISGTRPRATTTRLVWIPGDTTDSLADICCARAHAR